MKLDCVVSGGREQIDAREPAEATQECSACLWVSLLVDQGRPDPQTEAKPPWRPNTEQFLPPRYTFTLKSTCHRAEVVYGTTDWDTGYLIRNTGNELVSLGPDQICLNDFCFSALFWPQQWRLKCIRSLFGVCSHKSFPPYWAPTHLDNLWATVSVEPHNELSDELLWNVAGSFLISTNVINKQSDTRPFLFSGQDAVASTLGITSPVELDSQALPPK